MGFYSINNFYGEDKEMNRAELFGPGVKDQFPGLETVDRPVKLSFEDNEYYILHHNNSEDDSAPLFAFSDEFKTRIREMLNMLESASEKIW